MNILTSRTPALNRSPFFLPEVEPSAQDPSAASFALIFLQNRTQPQMSSCLIFLEIFEVQGSIQTFDFLMISCSPPDAMAFQRNGNPNSGWQSGVYWNQSAMYCTYVHDALGQWYTSLDMTLDVAHTAHCTVLVLCSK